MRRYALAAVFFVLLATSSAFPADGVKDKDAPRVSDELKSTLDNLEDRITSDPNDAQAIFQKATLLSKVGRGEEAQQLFEDLIDRFPGLPEPYNNLAALYASQGKLFEARNVLETLISSFPDLAVAHQNLGDIYAAMAASEYQKVIRLGGEEEKTRKKIKILLQVVDYIPSGSEKEAEIVQERRPVKYQEVDTSGMEQFDMTPSAEDIEMVMNNWAKAWSKRDADMFLAFYSPDFSGVEGMTPEDWRASMKKELKARKWIKVNISGITVDMVSVRKATAKFIMTYSSDLDENVAAQEKIIVLEMLEGRWRIVDEEKL